MTSPLFRWEETVHKYASIFYKHFKYVQGWTNTGLKPKCAFLASQIHTYFFLVNY